MKREGVRKKNQGIQKFFGMCNGPKLSTACVYRSIRGTNYRHDDGCYMPVTNTKCDSVLFP